MPNSIDFYKIIFLHVIPALIIVVWFVMKIEYYLELLTLGTMKLARSTKKMISKDEYGKNVPHLEIIAVVLVQWVLKWLKRLVYIC